jgi:multiple antibiotic resistance protein
MEYSSVDGYVVVDMFLLLLIGVGPKIALVPFLTVTAGMDDVTKARVTRKMLLTASVVAAMLLALGELFTRLLHFSTGALSIAGGLVLVIIAVRMVLGSGDSEATEDTVTTEDPMRLAVFPLAVPYLLNPAGFVALVTVSAEAASVGMFAVVAGLLIVVLALDVAVFRWANRIGEHLDPSRLLVTEKVFGFLLAALAVQLALNGLSDVGALHLTDH